MSLQRVEVVDMLAGDSPAIVVIDHSAGPSVIEIDNGNQPSIVEINQGPSGDFGAISTATGTNLTGYFYGDGTHIAGATPGSTSATANNIAIRNASGNLAAGAFLLPNGSFTGTIDNANLTANRTYTMPNASGYVALTTNANGAVTNSEVYAKAGMPISAGNAVYISGASGANKIIALAQANTDPLSSKTLGLSLQNLTTNQFGYVVTEGDLSGLSIALGNGHGVVEGDPIWLSPTTPGGLLFGIANKPSAPDHLVFIGVVTRINGNTLTDVFVKVQNGFELQELHNVAISNPLNGQPLVYDSTTELWKNEGQGGITCGSITFDNGQNSGVSIRLQINEDYPDPSNFTLPLNYVENQFLAVTSDSSGQVLFTEVGGVSVGLAQLYDVLTFDGSGWISQPNGTVTPDVLEVAKRNDLGGLNARHIRIYPLNYPFPAFYSQINTSPTISANRSFDFPNSSGVIATNNTALMLTGAQTAGGAKTFSGQVELTNQSATNSTSALTRSLGDARYGSIQSIASTAFTSTSNILAQSLSITLPIGIYQLDAFIASSHDSVAGCQIRLGTNNTIKVGLTDNYGRPSVSAFSEAIIDDVYTNLHPLAVRLDSGSTAYRRTITGIIEILTANTVISLDYAQNVPTPASPSTARIRRHLIARKVN